MVNILERVEAAMRSDYDDPMKQSELIEDAYRGASADVQVAIDHVFACLCGWSLKTILAGDDINEDEQ